MSFCMYWVLERRADDGTWEAMLSNVSLDRHEPSFARMVGTTIGALDPEFFAVMSGRPALGRGRINHELEPYATPGLPDDATDYAKGMLVHPIATGGYLDKSIMQDCGYLSLGALAEVAKMGRPKIGPDDKLSGNAPAEDYLARLYARLTILLGRDSKILSGQANLADQEILIGRITETMSGKVTHLGMDEMSHHTRLRLIKRLSEMKPCTDANLRMLIGYGMS